MMATYLDYNATSPVYPEAQKAVADALTQPGNPSSVHGFGRAARARINEARRAVAALVGADPDNVIFTSGATEANNTVLRSVGGPVAVSAVEHPSVYEAVPPAGRIAVDELGMVTVAEVRAYLDEHPDTALLSVMLVNNETGVIQPVAEIAALAKARGVLVHCDAVQAAGRIDVDMAALGVDYLSLSAHKLGGPPGCGALVLAPLVELRPLLAGGGQEKNRRAGTENVPAIAGFGVASQKARAGLADYARLAAWRDRLEEEIVTLAPEAMVIARNAPRVANTTMIALPGIASETQLMSLDLAGIAVSNGSACSSGKVKSSRVLVAMGYGPEIAGGALRVSMGWNSREEDINLFIEAWGEMYKRVRDKIGK